jgi:hypothetical protein
MNDVLTGPARDLQHERERKPPAEASGHWQARTAATWSPQGLPSARSVTPRAYARSAGRYPRRAGKPVERRKGQAGIRGPRKRLPASPAPAAPPLRPSPQRPRRDGRLSSRPLLLSPSTPADFGNAPIVLKNSPGRPGSTLCRRSREISFQRREVF